MGGSTQSKEFNYSQYQYLNEIVDPRLGKVKLYQKNETGETICVIDKIFLNVDKTFTLLDHPNILKIYHYKADQHKSVCSSYTKVQIIQEFVTNQLSTNITNRSNKQQFFEEKQLWGLLSMCLKALNYLKTFQIYPMNLRNLFISNKGTIKFDSYFDFQNSQYMQVFNFITEDIHLSPEELECLRMREVVLNLDYEKCEIFQLGLTALWAASLADTSSLFSYTSLQYSEQEMILRIEELNYSQQFKNILLKMLKRFPQDRGTFNEILQQVSYYECNENLLEIKQIEIQQQLSQKALQMSEDPFKNEEYQYQSQVSKISSQDKYQQMQFQPPTSNKIIDNSKQKALNSKINYKIELENQFQQDESSYSPQLSRKMSQISSTSKNQVSHAPKPTGILQNPLKQQIQQRTVQNITLQPDKLNGSDTSYTNRSILENKVEEAIYKSKQALAKFDQMVLYK